MESRGLVLRPAVPQPLGDGQGLPLSGVRIPRGCAGMRLPQLNRFTSWAR